MMVAGLKGTGVIEGDGGPIVIRWTWKCWTCDQSRSFPYASRAVAYATTHSVQLDHRYFEITGRPAR